jgi:hypothetical protein
LSETTPQAASGWASLFGFLAGPIAWAVQLNGIYIATPYLCGSPWTPIMYVFTALALLLTGAGLLVSWRSFEQAGRHLSTGGAAPLGRTRMMAIGGLAVNGFFLIVVIAQALPTVMLDPCLQ